MEQPRTFLPAWKRLGLKLQQSHEPEHTLHGDTQLSSRVVAPNEIARQEGRSVGHSSLQTSTLGKRKQRADAAGVAAASVKKSRPSEPGRADDDPANQGAAAASPEAGAAALATVASDAPADPTPSKGDSNYRKKKAGGDPNYRKKKEAANARRGQRLPLDAIGNGRDPSSGPAVPSTARTLSLSPGQPDLAANGSTLLPSTELGLPAPPALATPEPRRPGTSLKAGSASLSPPKADRRKSVTFTPDTKTSDGNSAANLFKQWVSEQKGSGADFTSAEISQFAEPPKLHIANDRPPSASEKLKGVSAGTKTKKKDPSRYLDYLTQYHQDRSRWKFSKVLQKDLLDNSLNIYRIPEEYSEPLLEYVSGLKGAGVIQRLKEHCEKAIQELGNADSSESMEEREVMRQTALQDRLTKERRRRRVEGDVELIRDHENPEGFVRRLKRERAEALCRILKVPLPPATTPQTGLQNTQPSTHTNQRKRKRRTDVSSDESTDSSSSEEESSSDEDTEEEDSSPESISDGDEPASNDKRRTDAETDSDSSSQSSSTDTSDDDSD